MNIDLKKDRKELYQPGKKEFAEVMVPPMRYVAIDGAGDPNTSAEYSAAVESLYTVAYSVRGEWKKSSGNAFVVGPLEGLWFSDDPAVFTAGDKDQWKWTMLIPLPDAVEESAIASGMEVAAKKKPELPISKVRVITLEEGLSLQIMHIGSYDDEAPTLAKLHDKIMPAQSLTFNGPHHEIYLSDPRKVAPEKLKTVLRQPVKKA